jgi:hypothetical protein
VSWLLVLLGVSGVEGRLLKRPGVLHGKLADQRRLPESLLKKHYDGFVVDLQDDVPLVVEALDKLSEGLSLLLYNAGQVLVNS